MKVIAVCGGRDYGNFKRIYEVLDQYLEMYGPFYLVEGGSRGADCGAYNWYVARGYPGAHMKVLANWDKHGRAAGPIRNQQIIDLYTPDLLIAFPGGKGTADMVSRAKKANITVVEVT